MHHDAFLYYEAHLKLYLNFGSSRLFRFLRYIYSLSFDHRKENEKDKQKQIQTWEEGGKVMAEVLYLVLLIKASGIHGRISMNMDMIKFKCDENMIYPL
jgi:hypothetical protein